MYMKYLVDACNYPMGKTPWHEKSTRWFIVAVFWFAVYSIKYDGANLIKRKQGGVKHLLREWKQLMNTNNSNRQYFRKCGCCGCRHEQSELIRTNNSPNGWICLECFNTYNDPDYEEF